MKRSKWLLLLLIAAVVMIMTGCGGEVRTSSETKVDNNWAGTRTITARFSRSTFNREVDSTINQLDQLIQEKCPSQLKWERELRSGYYEYHFQLNFTSMEDYKQKVEAIIGEPDHVTIETVDELYKEQITLKEDIEPSDLLEWLKVALAEEENETLTNVKKLFREYTNTLYCNEERMELEDDDYLNYTKERHVQFTGIDFTTEITTDNLFHRTIEIRMILDISEPKQAKIREVFTSRLPEGAVETWGEKDNQTFYQVSMQHMNPEQLTDFTNRVMEVQTSGMQFESTSDGMLEFRQDFQESIDLSSYFVGDVDEIPFLYYAKASDGIALMEQLLEEETEEEDEDISSVEFQKEFDTADNGYQILYDDEMDEETIAFSLHNRYTIPSIDVTTDVGWDNKFERTIVIGYDRIPLQKEQEAIQATMQEAAKGLSDIGLQVENNQFGIVVKQSGDAQTVTEAFRTLFQADSYVNYEQDYRGLFRFEMPYQFEEKLSFEPFLMQEAAPLLTYHTNFLNGEIVQEDENTSGKINADGKGYTETMDGLSVDVSIVATQQSYLPIFLIVLGSLIIGTVLLLTIRGIRRHLIKRKQKKNPLDTLSERPLSDAEEMHLEENNEHADNDKNLRLSEPEEKEPEKPVRESEQKQEEDLRVWMPPTKPSIEQNDTETVVEIKKKSELPSIRETKKRADIPTIREKKQSESKPQEASNLEAQLKEELEQTLAQEVKKTMEQKGT